MMSAPAKHVARELAAFAFAAGSLGFAAYAHDTATPCTGLYTCTLEMLHDREYQVINRPIMTAIPHHQRGRVLVAPWGSHVSKRTLRSPPPFSDCP